MKKKIIIVVWLITILLMGNLISIVPESADTNKSRAYTSHTPIYIDGNLGFNATNGVSAGDGTASNPYIIENWDIDATNTNGISIQNTDKYFIIRNCSIGGAGGSHSRIGILFNNVIHGIVDNCTLHNNGYLNDEYGIWLKYSNYNTIINCTHHYDLGDYSIYLYYSNYNKIVNCTFHDNHNHFYCGYLYYSNNNLFSNCIFYNNSLNMRLEEASNNTISNCMIYNNTGCGVDLMYSLNTTITGCTIYNNSGSPYPYGISLFNSKNTILRDNILTNNGANFGVWGEVLSDFYQDIDTSNKINNRPIYYIIQHDNLVYDGNSMEIGYIGFVSCKNVTVKNIDISRNIEGVILVDVKGGIITNSTIYENDFCGIGLFFSLNITINASTFFDNFRFGGISLFSSSNITIENCTLTLYDRIFLTSASSATAINTTFQIANFWDYESILDIMWYLNVKVVDSMNNPIQGANVRVMDNENGTFDQSYITDSDGWVKWIMCKEYIQNQTTSIYYTPHTVVISKLGYNTISTDILINSSKEIITALSELDMERPEISNIYDAPDPETVYGWVNITCTVTDDTAVSTVKVDITGPDKFTPVNVSMMKITGTNNYYYNTTYSVIGTYYYYIWANDTSNNENKSITHQFVITSQLPDTEKPQISNVQTIPSTQVQYDYVNISCRVMDNIAVSTVKIDIKGPAGFTLVNVTMTGIIGTNNYYYNTTYSVIGTYYYYIWANDTSNNQNTTYQYQFNITAAKDTERPQISNIQANPSVQAQDSYVNITCTVKDNVAVDIVKVNISGPADFAQLVTMTKIAETNNYYFNSTYSIPGKYSYYILAMDTSNNEEKSTEYLFTITIAVKAIVDGREVNVIGIGVGKINITSVALPYAPPKNLHYIGIQINITITGALTYANITIKYSDKDVESINESKLRMYYWSGNEWKLCSNTGVDTVNNIVWANVTHLTTFAPMAEKVTIAKKELQPTLFNFLLFGSITAIIVILVVAFVMFRKIKKLT